VVQTQVARPTLVGSAGYKGPPIGDGVEIGYSIVPSWRRRGLATEACGALIESAWARGADRVVAHTFAHLDASIGVLRKLGFELTESSDPAEQAFRLRRETDALRRFGLGEEDLAVWRKSGGDFDQWLTDRVARRPSGSRARAVYGAEDVHDFARRAILEALALGAGDHLLEIGCGGGLLLRDALRAGALATGIDHSEEMVELARDRAPGARVVLGAAEQLPFAPGTFTAVAMSVVFFFLEDPALVLREARRVLRLGGRVAIYTTGPELRGTPAAPEPVASLGHFYTDEQLAELASGAGLGSVAVRNERGGQLLTARSEP
jgi:SAM-dependent methyltransferase